MIPELAHLQCQLCTESDLVPCASELSWLASKEFDSDGINQVLLFAATIGQQTSVSHKLFTLYISSFDTTALTTPFRPSTVTPQ